MIAATRIEVDPIAKTIVKRYKFLSTARCCSGTWESAVLLRAELQRRLADSGFFDIEWA